MEEITYAFGWIDEPDTVAEIVSKENLYYEWQCAELIDTNIPDHFYGWKAAVKVLGDVLKNRNQGSVGSCVGFGVTKACEYTNLIEIATGDQEEFFDLAPEVTYGLSRVEIGGGRLRGDGSLGVWAAKAVTQYGLVRRGVYGSLDLTKYNEQTCRKLGNEGIPSDLEAIAKKTNIRKTTQVKNIKECKELLANGYMIAVCSNQGFTMQRNSNGVATPRGNWAHCMAITGYHKDWIFIDNSWGDRAHTGPTGPGDPPVSGFYADANVVDRMLKQNDSWSFADFNGFKKRSPDQLDWAF